MCIFVVEVFILHSVIIIHRGFHYVEVPYSRDELLFSYLYFLGELFILNSVIGL